MIVRDIMSRDVACVCSSDTIDKAASLMKEHDVGSIPVCDGSKVVGIVTDRDITLRSTASSGNPQSQKVSDIMTCNPTVGRPDMSVNDVAKVMSEKQIRRLPIVENDKLVGIVALGDISLEPNLQDSAEMALKNISKPDDYS